MFFRFVRVDGAFGSVVAMVGPVDVEAHSPQFALDRLANLEENRPGENCSGVLMLRRDHDGSLDAVCCDRDGNPSQLGWAPAFLGLAKIGAIPRTLTHARVNGVDIAWSGEDTGEGENWWLACQGLLIDG